MGDTAGDTATASPARLGIAELAELTGAPVDTLRRYAEAGLLPASAPADRDLGYAGDDLDRIRFIAARASSAPPGARPCGDGCACTAAPSATGAYAFPKLPSASVVERPAAPVIACTLEAGAMQGRMDDWQAVVARAIAREPIDDGAALTFPHDVALTAELGRLSAAEHACCSFASFTLTVDSRGVRFEVHTPPQARDFVVGLFGTSG